MKTLPIGTQSLPKLMYKNGIYVDKTQLIHQLVTNLSQCFFSRPRRFGKSLLVSTLQELFEGNQLLFKDLWIEQNWDWSKQYPVISLSFLDMDYQDLGLSSSISELLNKIALSKSITLTKKTPKAQFQELIETLYKQHGKVVVLIDEYDKPITQYLEDNHLKQAKANQKVLKNFFSALKGLDDKLHFLFITGVSKFTKVSIFSDLNHLVDISLNEKYANLTGYTQTELEHYFSEYLQLAENKLNISRQQLMDQIRLWYNGYSWDGNTRLYNPFGVLNFLEAQVFRNYWFATGTPTFLLEQMKKYGQFEIAPIKVDSTFFEKYDLDNIEVYQLLFQTGYLTIQKINPITDEYWLGFPNKEVNDSLYSFFVHSLMPRSQRPRSGMTMDDLRYAFETNRLPRVKVIIDSYLGELPETVFRHTAEGLFHGLIHIIFKYLGTMIDSEVYTARGRSDVVVQTDTHVFIFEFKFNESADAALQQIHTNGYANRYLASEKTITAIGVNFSDQQRTIQDWKTELI
jgi:Predicted AAA-ATPase/PD-(D/E)XK nuclease superfamily